MHPKKLILHLIIFYSENAEFHVGDYYANNGLLNNSNLYWLNNFTTLQSSYGIQQSNF